MNIRKFFIFPALFLMLFLFVDGCEKEKIVESTEYIRETEYVDLPPDTIFYVDSIFVGDSVIVNNSDTVTIYVHDTVFQNNNNYDTVLITDTIVTVVNHYDTINTVDTILTVQCDPNEFMAATALEYHCNPLVIEYIYNEYGYNDGWVFYLNTFQVDLTAQSSDVYDIYGFLDYWTPDWSGFEQLEFYYRMVYNGGDPADVNNWSITEPPASSSHTIGLSAHANPSETMPRIK